jgi:acyl-CoA reductase-like NAD-dependent aldehyde dehydrogenase
MNGTQAAFDGWRTTPPRDRGRCLLRAAELLRQARFPLRPIPT